MLTQVIDDEAKKVVVEVVSKMEHKLIDATNSLKSALKANSTFERKIRKYDTKLGQAQSKCAYLEAKDQRWVAEYKKLENNFNDLTFARDELLAEKEAVEAQLWHLKSHILGMCEESFNQAV